MRKRVRCISNWSDSYSLHMRIINQFAPHYNVSESEIDLVDDDSYEYLVVFNDAKGFPIKDKAKTLGWIQEPPDHDSFYDKQIGSYCNQVYTCAHSRYYHGGENYVLKSGAMFYHFDMPVGYLMDTRFEKSKQISCVVSGIKGGFYDFRLSIAETLKRVLPEMDVFGGPFKGRNIPNHGRIENKYDALHPYQFSLCLENGNWEGYISDKIIDAILCDCVPIYLGDIESARKLFEQVTILNAIGIEGNTHMIDRSICTADFQHAKHKWFKECNMFDMIKEFVMNN